MFCNDHQLITGAYDFGARLFAPADSRWTTPDPLA